MNDLPRKVRLTDGTAVTFRLLIKGDVKALTGLYKALPKKERVLLREDVSDAEVVERQCQPDLERVLPVAAMAGRRLAAVAFLHRHLHSWSRHVGEIRVVVHPDFRRRGLATRLIAELGTAAAGWRQEILKIELPDVSTDLMAGLHAMGFGRQAELTDAILDQAGKTRNLIVTAGPTMSVLKRLVTLIRQSRPDKGRKAKGS